MRNAGAAAVFLLSLAACHSRTGPSALAYKRPLDVLSVGLGLSGQPCFTAVEPPSNAYANPTKVSQFIGYDACYRFQTPQRFSGVWFDEVEYSVFFKDASDVPKGHVYGQDTHLIVDPGLRRELEPDIRTRHAFKIEFTGRRTMFPGPYNSFSDVVIVDRVEQVSKLPTPSPFLVPKVR